MLTSALHPSRLAASLLLASTPLLAADWAEFRGPNTDGTAPWAKGVPTTLGEDQNVKWKTPIHGKGWSSPIVVGDRIWLTTATEDGTKLSVIALEKDSGKIVLDKVLFTVDAPQFCHKFNSYASPTPVAANGVVYVTFGSPGTAALDARTGDVLWQRTDFVCNHFRGAGSSPILWNNLLIMNFDGSDFQFVAALDQKTGKTAWKTDRSVDYKDLDGNGKPSGDGDYRKGFATPLVTELNGKPVLISSGAKAHYGYDPATGKELWRFEERAQHSASTRPVVANGHIFIQTGFGKGQLIALKTPADGLVPDSSVAWRISKGVANKPSLIHQNGLLFMIDDAGIGSCIEAASGNVVWSQRVGGNFSASPILADGKIVLLNEEGKATTIAPEREFKLLGEGKFESGFMASPAVDGNDLVLRTKTALYRVGSR
jgi:outer membrane protein assembly factor BamB